ncbi:Alphabeta hydrolase fold [Penicillium angulare]|uniref:Alphabeta hydrolase fold n=1 Tax=Penicillium angulare TaxID=116970 RepID=UPI0025411D41|nr:Alphabeta hydrolase fold [Penicillium angulare]KAJ5280956.1 Alphabeta hydrolase fold [Penicillium angulare]
MPPKLPEGGKTLVYSTVDNHEIKFDYWLPRIEGNLPAMIYYHGGGMTAGSRRGGGFPHWMYNHCQDKGYIFISADYRLCHPSNAIDQIEDAKALFTFLSGPSFATHLSQATNIDTARIAVTGFSAGAYSARAACLYATPKPAALLSVYGLGGHMLLDHWTAARPPTSLAKFFDLNSVPALLADKTIVSDDVAEGFATKRFALTIHWEITGTFLDGVFQRPGLGEMLNAFPVEKRFEAVPEILKSGMLQEFVTGDYPPSVFVHGKADEVVTPAESEFHHEQLGKLGIATELFLIKDGPHGLEGSIKMRKAMGQEVEGGEKVIEDCMEAYSKALVFIDGVFAGI